MDPSRPGDENSANLPESGSAAEGYGEEHRDRSTHGPDDGLSGSPTDGSADGAFESSPPPPVSLDLNPSKLYTTLHVLLSGVLVAVLAGVPLFALGIVFAVTTIIDAPQPIEEAAYPLTRELSADQRQSLLDTVAAEALAEAADFEQRDGRDVLVVEKPTDAGSEWLAAQPELGIVTDVQLGMPEVTPPPLLILGSLVILQLVLLVIGTWRARALRDPQELVWSTRSAIGLGVLTGGIALIAATLIGWIQTALGLPVEEQTEIQALLAGERWILVTFAVMGSIFVPWSEEVFFRHYLFRRLSLGFGIPVSAVVSALAFTAVHFNPSGIAVYATYGLLLAWCRQRSRRTLAPIVAHMLLNSVILIGYILTQDV